MKDIYEYRILSVSEERWSELARCYACFGWEEESGHEEKSESEDGKRLLYLRRSTELASRMELTRLQRNAESLMSQIHLLEQSKSAAAFAASFVNGFLGAFLIGLSIFIAVVHPSFVIPDVLSGIAGIAACFGGWLVHKPAYDKRAEAADPVIAKKRDEIGELCRRGQSLLEE